MIAVEARALLCRTRRSGFAVRHVLVGALSSVTAALSTAAAQSPAPGRAIGWAFSYTVSTTVPGRQVQRTEMAYDVLVWHGAARISVRSGPLKRLAGDSGVILVRATDSVLSVINPIRREVLQAAVGDLSTLVAGGPTVGMQLDVSDITSRTRSRGRGEPLGGYATQRHQLDQRYTLMVTANTVQRRIRDEQQLTIDASVQIDQLDAGFRAFTEQFARSLGQPAAVRRALLAASRVLVRGFPVRTITQAVTIAGSDTLRSETRAGISALRQTPVDTAAFRLPADYRVTDMSRLLRPRRQP